MHIDFLSATFNVAPTLFKSKDFQDLIVYLAPIELRGKATLAGRKPYREGISYNDSGIRLYHGGHDNALIEITGQACQQLSHDEMLAYLQRLMGVNELGLQFNKFTRLDIAQDFRTDETVAQTLDRVGIAERIKTVNKMSSASGETVYVGSRKSTRFFRVYRYNDEKHPRHGLTRFECQFTKDVATSIATMCVNGGMTNAFYTAYSKAFVELPPEDFERVKVSADKPIVRDSASTLLWVTDAVVPAVARLIRENQLSLVDFVQLITEKVNQE